MKTYNVGYIDDGGFYFNVEIKALNILEVLVDKINEVIGSGSEIIVITKVGG